MQVCLLKSKIHRATITDGNLKYEGSLTIATDLMEKCGLIPYERILCSNMANGNRFETYAIPGDPGSGQIVLNGAAAFQGKRGDVLTIMSFAHVPKRKIQHWKPRVIVLGKCNRIVKNAEFNRSETVPNGHEPNRRDVITNLLVWMSGVLKKSVYPLWVRSYPLWVHR